MSRRLLAQLGLAAVALAATGGIALADSSPTSATTAPGANQQQGSGSNVSLNTTGSVTIQSSQTSSQQTGGGSPTLTNDSGSTPPTAGSPDPSASVSNPADATPSNHSLSIGSDGTPPASNQTPTTNQSTSSTATLTSGDTPSPSAMALALHRAAAVVAAAPYPTVVQARAASDIPQPPAPAPHSPVGFLGQLNLMMALVVPVAQTLPGLLAGTTLASILITLALAALRGAGRQVTSNSYTARLRQSGFLGAARSDVAAAHLSFATPLEMGCISRVCAT